MNAIECKPKAAIQRADGTYEQIVMAEVLIPDTLNTWGDLYTRESIKEFAYGFMRAGLNVNIINDVEHDNIDVTGKVYVVESFIARAGDPDFIEGSWVIAVKIEDEDMWQDVLENNLNGFSFQAVVNMLPVEVENLRSRIVTGTTAPDPLDGHTHIYSVVVNELNVPVSGSTGETDGHSHTITTHTVTGTTNGHSHRFQVIN